MKNAKACYRKMAYLNALGSSKYRLDSMNGHLFFFKFIYRFSMESRESKTKTKPSVLNVWNPLK